MEQDNDQVKQQSERQLKELEKRRILEQRRADFYALRQRELEEAQRAKQQATKDVKDKKKALKVQIALAKQAMKARAA